MIDQFFYLIEIRGTKNVVFLIDSFLTQCVIVVHSSGTNGRDFRFSDFQKSESCWLHFTYFNWLIGIVGFFKVYGNELYVYKLCETINFQSKTD